MTEIDFYQLRTTPLERALPKLLERVLESGRRAVVLGGSEERIETLNASLWTYRQQSFLPHGSARDGYPESQPVYLTTAEENPNSATVLVLVDGLTPGIIGDFDRCLDLFDGNDAQAVGAAQDRQAARKNDGHTVVYWLQTEGGKWLKQD